MEIPAIDVRATLLDLGLQEDGTLEVPKDFAAAGWFEHGPAPGQTGPAVIAGHLDSPSGPAVFYRLSHLRPGDLMRIGRQDGSTAAFAVERVEQYPKAEFPTDDVYGWVDHPALRLIICGGTFDHDSHRHLDNVVVYASMVETQ